MFFHLGMRSESVHVFVDGWSCVHEVKLVPCVLPWTILQEEKPFKEREAVHIQIHRIITSKEAPPLHILLAKVFEFY